MYRAKRVLRAPIIWYGRRRHADEPPEVRWRLEHVAYRKRARRAWDNTAVDPMHFYRCDLDDGSVVVDLGAFTGEVARDIRRLYDCRVVAFEPHPTYSAQLSERFADDPEVTVVRYGVGGSDATLPMAVKGLGSTVHADAADDEETVDVEIRDVAEALDALGLDRIDFLKVNIEGAEYDVLDRLLSSGWMDRIRYVLIQFHEWYPGADQRRWRIRRRLRTTHDQVWDYPWVYELWCARSDPHPPPLVFSRADLAEIGRALAAARAAGEATSAADGPEGEAPRDPDDG